MDQSIEDTATKGRRLPGGQLLPWLGILAAVGGLWSLLSVLGPATIGGLVSQWYAFLNNLFLVFGFPLKDLADNLNIPLASAILLGMVGALSPCQLSTGAAALAYLSPQVVQPRAYAASIAAYLAGKVTVYTLLGGAALLAGLQMNDSIPFIQAVRKALGPIMFILALQLFGLLKLQLSIGEGASQWLEERFAGGGVLRAYALGVAFSLAFCPTLFLLFFGLLLPLALTRPLGIIYPGLFAIGTALPLVILASMLALGAESLGDSVRRVGRIERFIQPVAAAVLLLAGLNDTIVYWFV